MSAKEKFQLFLGRYNEAKKSMEKVAKESFKELADDVFNRWPEMESFSWHQYTQHFNDGDPVTFNVYADNDSIEINDQSLDDAVPYTGDYEEWKKVRDKSSFYKQAKEVSAFLFSFPQDLMQQIFGDGYKIIVNRDGTSEVEDYDHD